MWYLRLVEAVEEVTLRGETHRLLTGLTDAPGILRKGEGMALQGWGGRTRIVVLCSTTELR